MRIQYLNGGLANQVFQYIFVRFAELYYPEGGPWSTKCITDMS